jgi:hypothetical protein
MSRRIPDPVSLITGIAFTGIGLTFLVGDVNLADRYRWMWPIVLVSLGAGILAAVLGRATAQPADQATPAGTTPIPDAAEQPPTGAPTPEPPEEPGAGPLTANEAAAAPGAAGPAEAEAEEQAAGPDEPGPGQVREATEQLDLEEEATREETDPARERGGP